MNNVLAAPLAKLMLCIGIVGPTGLVFIRAAFAASVPPLGNRIQVPFVLAAGSRWQPPTGSSSYPPSMPGIRKLRTIWRVPSNVKTR